MNGSVGKIVAFMTGEEANPLKENKVHYEGFPDEAEIGASSKSDLTGIDVAQAALTERERAMLKLDPGEYPDKRIPTGSWPVVLFQNGMKMLLPPLAFSIQNSQGDEEAVREQVPLILAWACVKNRFLQTLHIVIHFLGSLSIHKSQGQTLERVKVDLGDAFEAGQGYVALSRATQIVSLKSISWRAS